MVDVTVKAWMSGDPVSLSVEETSAEALAQMQRHHIRHLPVVDAHRRVVGVVSLNDLYIALGPSISIGSPLPESARDTLAALPVEAVMTPSPFVLMDSDPLSVAADRMADTHVGCLPIVDGSGRLVGVISETDALRALATAASPRRGGA